MEKPYNPGFSFAPPETWKFDQKEPPKCIPNQSCLSQPVPVFDKGLPSNALEYTGVGSILPKFGFDETYNSKYYKDNSYNVFYENPDDSKSIIEENSGQMEKVVRRIKNNSDQQMIEIPRYTAKGFMKTSKDNDIDEEMNNRVKKLEDFRETDNDALYGTNTRRIADIIKDNKLTKLLDKYGHSEGQLKTDKDFCNMFCTNREQKKDIYGTLTNRPCTKVCLKKCGKTGICSCGNVGICK